MNALRNLAGEVRWKEFDTDYADDADFEKEEEIRKRRVIQTAFGFIRFSESA